MDFWASQTNLGSNSLRYPEMPWFEKYQNIPNRVQGSLPAASPPAFCVAATVRPPKAPQWSWRSLQGFGGMAPGHLSCHQWNGLKKNCETCCFTLQSSGQTSMDWLPKLKLRSKKREFPWPRLDDGIRRVQVTTQIWTGVKMLKTFNWLVVEPYPSEKWWSSSVGIIIPNIWKNKKCSKPPTR